MQLKRGDRQVIFHLYREFLSGGNYMGVGILEGDAECLPIEFKPSLSFAV